jgi:ferric-dicitrate binding protein FerR (iron transport regulator)
MASKNRIDKASAAAQAARSNQYVQRLLEDEDLRGSLLAAYASARSAFERVNNGKPASKAIFEDKKLQQELTDAANALRDAAGALKQAPPARRRKKRGAGRGLLLVLVAAVAAVALSESLRSKVLDLLFGSEEEYDYSSTTIPPSEAPTPAPSPAA